jgi:hypothetical protein
MESKKINQLATELAPDLSDLTIIGDPTTGISKKITLSQMASLFTGTVEEYANLAAFPITGVADTIYIALDTNVIYRWDSTSYVVLSPNIIASLVFSDANGFDGTISLVGSVATLTITTALTSGSVPFIGASGALTQDNSNLFFDDTNNRLGIATASPTTPLDVFGSGIIGRLNATSTNNSFLGFSSNGTNKWSAGNVQSDHRFRIFSEANSAELITILQTGEFGIGIANPTTKFHIDGAASALIANLDANVSIAKSVSYRSDNSARINLEVSGTESGSNVGADFFLRTFTDAGSLLETPFTIVRSTGVTTIKSLTLTNVLSVANGGTGSATQNFVDLTSVQTAAGAKTFSAITTISNATASTSTTTGGLVVTGGVGIGGALFGTSATFSSTMTSNNVFITNSANADILEIFQSPSTLNSFIDYPSGRSLIIRNKGTAGGLTLASTGAATFTDNVTMGGNTLISTGATGFTLKTTTTGAWAALYGDTGGLYLGTNAGNWMFINNSGNVGIGTTTITNPNSLSKILEIKIANSVGIVLNDSRDANPIGLENRGAVFHLSYGTTSLIVADGSSRNVGIGNATQSGQRLRITGEDTSATKYSLVVVNSVQTDLFYIRNDGVLFSPTTYANTTASAANFNIGTAGDFRRSTSSIRFKTNVEDLTIDTTNILSKMRPIWYRSLGSNDRKDWSWYGFIAEELAEIEPRLVHWGYDSNSYEQIEIIDEEGNIKQETKLKEDAKLIPDGVQYERITVFLVAELQKMRKELDALKAK